MERLFFTVLRMSLEGSIVILAVLLARLLLQKAPKKYSYFLWAVVGLRLICPFHIESAFSLFRLPGLRQMNAAPAAVPPMEAPGPAPVLPQTNLNMGAAVPAQPVQVPSTVQPTFEWSLAAVLAAFWLAGTIGFVLYSVFSEVRLRKRLATATKLQDHVFQSENVRSPFVLGVLRPRIYMPYGLEEEAQRCVLAHEQTHLRRGDPLFRRIAFLILAVHWFNPLCWLAFQKMGMDMELSCDEAVLKAGTVSAKNYSLTLLAFAANRRSFAAAPLSFGETGVKKRIKNALGWKKPGAVLTALALILSCGISVACAADPQTEPAPQNKETEMQAPLPTPIPRKQTTPCARAEMYYLPGNDRLEEYDEEGFLLRLIELDSERRVTFFEEHYYDENHREIEVQEIDPEMFPTAYDFMSQDRPRRVREYAEGDGSLVGDYWYEYDSYGRVIQKEHRDSEGNANYREQYEYAKNGKVSLEATEQWDDTLGKWNRSSNRYEYNAAGLTIYEENIYGEGRGRGVVRRNDNGNLLEVSEYKADGTRKFTEEYEYDEHGRHIRTSLFNSYGTESQRTEIEYEPNYFSHFKKKTYWRFGLIEQQSVYEYSDDGYTEHVRYYKSKALIKREEIKWDLDDNRLGSRYFDAAGNEISEEKFWNL